MFAQAVLDLGHGLHVRALGSVIVQVLLDILVAQLVKHYDHQRVQLVVLADDRLQKLAPFITQKARLIKRIEHITICRRAIVQFTICVLNMIVEHVEHLVGARRQASAIYLFVLQRLLDCHKRLI